MLIETLEDVVTFVSYNRYYNTFSIHLNPEYSKQAALKQYELAMTILLPASGVEGAVPELPITQTGFELIHIPACSPLNSSGIMPRTLGELQDLADEDMENGSTDNAAVFISPYTLNGGGLRIKLIKPCDINNNEIYSVEGEFILSA